jgi:hypothetical protein
MAATDTTPTGRKTDKVIRDALKAALRQDPERLKRVAEKAWEMAEEGNLAAFKEIADRLDGKAVQPIVGGDDDQPPINTSITVSFVK